MKIIGIAGGIASGKSLVGRQLQQLGAERIDADRIGHEVLREEQIKKAVRDYWGSAVFEENGEIDRRALGKAVFGPPPEGPTGLAYLEKLTHPLIGERIQEQIETYRRNGCPAVILDAPVMFKAGWDEFCDRILFVQASPDVRRQRALARGWSDEEFESREAAQESLERKKQRSDTVIDNNGTMEATHTQVLRWWNESIGSLTKD